MYAQKYWPSYILFGFQVTQRMHVLAKKHINILIINYIIY